MKRIGAMSLAVMASIAIVSAQITDIELLKPKPENWLHYSASYDSQRHSPLKQITPENVGRLQAKWAYHLVGQQHIQAVPIVADGVMYISQYNRVDALDARTGAQIWQFQREPVTATSSARHGRPWQQGVRDDDRLDARRPRRAHRKHDLGNGRRRRPLSVRGSGAARRQGQSHHDRQPAVRVHSGLRCRDRKTLWTWNAIPQSAKDPGAETWAGDSWKLGGGPIWVSGSFDPELNTIFYGTGQPGSQWAGEVREGDNLYTDCLVALDVDTGKMKWYFQATPHDVRDWDSLEMPILIDRQFRRTAAQAARAGEPQRLLLRARSHQRTIPARHAVCQPAQLVERLEPGGAADPHSRQ